MMDWKKNWHPRGDKTPGNIKRGLGLSMHTWGGRGHNSNCDFTIHPDGSVEMKLGTQDLGTGCLTIITIVAADTLGIPMENIKVMHRRQPLSSLRRQRWKHNLRRRNFVYAAWRGGCAQRAVCEGCSRAEGQARGTGSRRRAGCKCKATPPRPLMERSLRQDRRGATYRAGQEPR